MGVNLPEIVFQPIEQLINMKTNLKTLIGLLALIASTLFFTSCQIDDPGPLQFGERTFTIENFNRLEMGSAFTIIVRQGTTFSVEATGDVRNLDDLVVIKNGSTLVAYYDRHANRRHTTTLHITLPDLASANFSGASISDIQGFERSEQVELVLSGASMCKLYPGFTDVKLNLSGASELDVSGSGTKLLAALSGASKLKAHEFAAENATLDVSGASTARVSVREQLTVVASGASSVRYHGNPTVHSTVTGGSTLIKE